MSAQALSVEVEELRLRLEEAEETLAAIRSGKVDGLVVSGPQGEQVFALRGAEQPYRVFLETMHEGAATLLASGTITFSNRRLAEMLQLPLERIVGRNFEDFAVPQQRPGVAGLLRKALSGPLKCEAGLCAAGGSTLWLELSLCPTQMQDEPGICLVAADVTERKRNEETLREWNARLESRVAERTAELLAANQELESFSYSVSHDLRAPLRAMDAFSQRLLENYAAGLPPEARNLLQRVRASSQHMDELVKALLALSHTTRTEMRCTRVALSELCRTIALELRKSDPQREVEFVIAPDLQVNGDRDLLELVMQNLLDNAWKYTGKKPRARIEVGTIREAGELVYFVRDDGAGFDMAYVEKLFRVFERLHGRSEFPGTGVGLATVKRVIQRHGGKVWAEGAVDKGATFFFTLPAAERWANEDQEHTADRR